MNILFRPFALWTIIALSGLSPLVPLTPAGALEFDTGRPQPAVNGAPVLASGLSLSKGHLRGVPAGELAGWTASLWFRVREPADGTIFGLEVNSGEEGTMRLAMENGDLVLTGPAGNKGDQFRFETGLERPENWNHAAITYRDEIGLAFYLNGELVDAGTKSWLGYAVSFKNYFFGGELDEDGEEVELFEGWIDDFALYNQPFTEVQVKRLYEDERFEDALIMFHDFENVDHRSLARYEPDEFPDDYLAGGKKLYQMNCIACHSKDGVAPAPNPLTRDFVKNEMENGGDPYGMFRTLTYGYRNMMASVQLAPAERYQVIHYLRQEIIKPKAPDLYVEVDGSYTSTMPTNPASLQEQVERMERLASVGYLRDYGGALINPVIVPGKGMLSRNALVLDLGDETTFGYDLATMGSIGAWTGGFLDFRNTLHHRLRASGRPLARFDFLPGIGVDRWAWDGKAEKPVPELSEKEAWPVSQVRYGGHFVHGDEVVIRYTVQGRQVHESPVRLSKAEGGEGSEPVIARRFTVMPGDEAIELLVAGGQVKVDGTRAVVKDGDAAPKAYRLHGDGVRWRVTEAGDQLVLVFEPGNSVAHSALVYDDGEPAEEVVVDLTEWTSGGPRRWLESHTLKGSLAVDEFQDYALDSVPVPLKNAYNTWMRTASLGFFPDGRLAVGTLSGDIWIVEGIDDELEEVTWKRFAAGLYEPMGLKVVDGVLTATTRGRIVKLHDLNGDGEADFYEAFFNEEHQDPGWHAYNFDLIVDDEGYYYFAKTGGFSDWEIPGGLIKVAPDGRSWDLLGEGMRVPNGLGRLPDGRITYGDNQGTWVPASKIVVASKPGSFLGAGKWTDSVRSYDPEKRVRAMVLMPQELDSSAGSQLWVGQDDRFGPLSGQFFHTSYGRARTMTVMIDEFGDTIQGAVFPVPVRMESGTMRLAVNPTDGQLYYSGMTGWQSGATREGSIQRLRYRGTEEGLYLLDTRAREGRLELDFDKPLDPAVVDDLSDWQAEAWNYVYSKGYGSPHMKVTAPDERGTDLFEIDRATLSEDGRTLTVHIGDLQPCHTLRLKFDVEGRETGSLQGPVYFTIHELPE